MILIFGGPFLEVWRLSKFENHCPTLIKTFLQSCNCQTKKTRKLNTNHNNTAHLNGFMMVMICYSVFHRFRQAKFAYGGLILSSSQFFATAPAASKNGARFKSGQSWLKNNCLATWDLNPWNSLYVLWLPEFGYIDFLIHWMQSTATYNWIKMSRVTKFELVILDFPIVIFFLVPRQIS